MPHERATHELQRQQWLLQRLRALEGRPADAAPDTHWLAHPRVSAERGLRAYRINAAAVAERALAASYPTVQAMLGDAPFAAVAHALWHQHPPSQGDLATWGAALPEFLAAAPALAEWPYLADSARLDWALAQAERAADDAADLSTLPLLGEADPAQLRLTLAPGAAVLRSAHPVVTLWQAHATPAATTAANTASPTPPAANALAAARDALAQGRAEHAFVWRPQWRAQACPIDEATATWTQALLHGAPLDEALATAGETFSFETWLLSALQQGWLRRVSLTLL